MKKLKCPYKTIKSELVSGNSWWKHKEDIFELPNGDIGTYNYIETMPKHSVIVIPKYYKDKDEFLMIYQYRYLFDKYCIEFPGGFVDPNIYDPVDYAENANNELREETGFSAMCLSELGEMIPYKGISTEISYVYLLEHLCYNPLPPEKTEFCELLVLSSKQINRLIELNKITDMFTISAWKMYEEYAKNKNNC